MAIEKNVTVLFLRLIALVIYMLRGSLAFSYIELKQSSMEDLNLRIVQGMRLLLQNHSCATNFSETELQAFTDEFIEQMKGAKERWQFQDGLQFSFELLTTIGDVKLFLILCTTLLDMLNILSLLK